jgi:hypothetical protein
MTRGWLACGVVALAAMAGGTGCATIMKGTRQRVSVFAAPSGSQVTIYDSSGSVITSQMAPCTVRLARGSGFFSAAEYRVQVEKQGHAPAIFTISGSLGGGWYIVGNFFIGGLVGWLIVDPLSGAMWNLHPRAVNAVLAPQTSSRPGGDAELRVTLRPQAPPERRQ